MAKIFIVDDDPGCVQLLERFLGKRGYEVASSSNGLTAAQDGAREKPDLILLDFVIPAADGRVLLDRFRAAPETARAPVLVITGAPLADVMARLPDRGLRFIEKPLDLGLLERLVAELLGPLAAPPPAPAAPELPPIPPLAPRPSAPAPLDLADDAPPPPAGDTLDLDS